MPMLSVARNAVLTTPPARQFDGGGAASPIVGVVASRSESRSPVSIQNSSGDGGGDAYATQQRVGRLHRSPTDRRRVDADAATSRQSSGFVRGTSPRMVAPVSVSQASGVNCGSPGGAVKRD